LWAVRAGDAVFQPPTVVGDRVLFGSRDGHLYVVRADTGAGVLKVNLGGPVVAPPAVAGDRVYVATVGGVLRCLNLADGAERWAFDLGRQAGTVPVVVAGVRAAGGRVYLAAELTNPGGGMAAIYCLDE
jgi:outer membrane protein assembly factor BamB